VDKSPSFGLKGLRCLCVWRSRAVRQRLKNPGKVKDSGEIVDKVRLRCDAPYPAAFVVTRAFPHGAGSSGKG
jgi:hypothetical protein